MKVYEDMRGSYILIRKPSFEVGTEFMVIEHESLIILQRIN